VGSEIRFGVPCGQLGGDVVLVGEPAGDLLPADPEPGEVYRFERAGAGLSWCELAEGTVRPGGVAGRQVFGQHPSQVVLIDDQQLCACRKLHPCRSGDMSVLVDHSTEAVVSAYVEAGDPVRISNRFGDGAQRCCLSHGLVGPVGVVVPLVLAQGSAQVGLVPDQGAIQEFVAAGLHPSLHERVGPHRQLHPFQMIDTAVCG
jgi:hypothetical protein